MALEQTQEQSIIGIIERMVKEGQPESKILASLKALGVREDQAKKLLLLGESDTFTLLKNEIRKIVHEDMSKEEELLKQVIRQVIVEEEKKLEQKMDTEMQQLKEAIGAKLREEQTTEAKSSKLREIMRILESPETTHGIKFDLVSTEKKKKESEGKFKEVKL